jgi:hypothetical protein
MLWFKVVRLPRRGVVYELKDTRALGRQRSQYRVADIALMTSLL